MLWWGLAAWLVLCSSTLHPCRYEELKSLVGGLKADADGMASKADRAYQGSLVLLKSLSRLTKTDISSFEVRALCLRDQEIPFCSPLHPSCQQVSPSQGSGSTGEPSDMHPPILLPAIGTRSKREASVASCCSSWGDVGTPRQSSHLCVSGGSNPAEAGRQCSPEPGGHLHGTVQAAAEPHGALGGRNQAAAAEGRGRESGKRLTGGLRLESSSA